MDFPYHEFNQSKYATPSVCQQHTRTHNLYKTVVCRRCNKIEICSCRNSKLPTSRSVPQVQRKYTNTISSRTKTTPYLSIYSQQYNRLYTTIIRLEIEYRQNKIDRVCYVNAAKVCVGVYVCHLKSAHMNYDALMHTYNHI